MTGNYSVRPPWWFILLLVVLFIPVVATPWMISQLPPSAKEMIVLFYLYPLYVLVADWLAWVCYQPRRMMAWIMVALVALSHLAVAMTVFQLVA